MRGGGDLSDPITATPFTPPGPHRYSHAATIIEYKIRNIIIQKVIPTIKKE